MESAEDLIRRAVAAARAQLGDRYRGTYVLGSHARGDALETSDVDVSILARGTATREEMIRATEQFFYAAGGDPRLDCAIVFDNQFDARDVIAHRLGARHVDGEDVTASMPFPSRPLWEALAFEAALQFVGRNRPRPLRLPLEAPNAAGEFLGYDTRTVVLPDGTEVPSPKEALTVAGRVATALVARRSGRLIANRPQAIAGYAEDVADGWTPYLLELQRTIRTEWQYRIPADADGRSRLRALCERTFAFERHFVDVLSVYLNSARTEDDPQASRVVDDMRARIGLARS